MFNPIKMLPPSVVLKTSRAGLHVKKHAPIILFGTGVAGAVTSTVLACKATLKLTDVLQEAEKDKLTLQSIVISDEFSQKDLEKNLNALKLRTAGRLAKLYAPAGGLMLLSIGALTGSHYIMSKRQAALMAAYAGLDQAYKKYQDRVREELGAEREEQLRHGAVVREEKAGNGRVVKKYSADPNSHSVYARVFAEETSDEWQREPEYNFLMLKAKQQYFNNILHSRGHVFLNEVYDSLGLARSKAGAVVGWVLDNGSDNYVDFGFMNVEKDGIRDFVNMNEAAVWLDFNVDGVILDKI